MSVEPAAALDMIPVIETERLLLRPHRMSDFEAYAAMWGDPETTRFIGGTPRSRETAWSSFLRGAGLWMHFGFGYWAIEDRATGRFAGDVGLANFKREIDPPLGDAPEMGWTVATEFRGKGVASEAGAGVVSWADAAIPDKPLVCIVEPNNAASIRIAEKLGFREARRTTYHGDATIVFERPRRPA